MEDVPFAGVTLARACLDVAYGPHPCQKLDAYLVAGPGDAPAPVLIELHGGAFWGGAKSGFGAYLDQLGTGDGLLELALRHGISVVSVGYRLSSQTDGGCAPILDSQGKPAFEPAHAFPVPHVDAGLALAFVRARAASGEWNVDSERIAVAGISAGGTLALGLAFGLGGAAGAGLGPGAGALPAPVAGSVAAPRELRAVLSLLAPTDFTPAAFALCGPSHPGAFHFGAADPWAFESDPGVLARRHAASPVSWVASAGFVPRETAFYGLYLGDPGWTSADVYLGGVPCGQPYDPLALPTSNPHAAPFGLLLGDTLSALGVAEVLTRLVDPAACDLVGPSVATEAADFLAGHLDLRPGFALRGGSAPAPCLRVFGSFGSDALATLWVRDAPPLATALLHLSPQQVPTQHPGGVLLPGGEELVTQVVGASDGCGFLAHVLATDLLADGPLFAQLELVPAGGGAPVLSNAWRLE